VAPPREDAVVSSEKSKKKTDFSDEVKQVTQEIIETLVKHEPHYTPPKNIAPMMQEVDYMLRVKKWDGPLLLKVLNWALTDHFWKGKVYKPNPAKYLHTHFLTWKNTMDAPPPKNNNKVDRRRRDNKGEVIEDNYEQLLGF